MMTSSSYCWDYTGPGNQCRREDLLKNNLVSFLLGKVQDELKNHPDYKDYFADNDWFEYMSFVLKGKSKKSYCAEDGDGSCGDFKVMDGNVYVYREDEHEWHVFDVSFEYGTWSESSYWCDTYYYTELWVDFEYQVEKFKPVTWVLVLKRAGVCKDLFKMVDGYL